MKILNTTLVIALALTSFSVKAQTGINTATKAQTVTPTSHHDYYSAEFEKKIKSKLISGKIPASFPKHTAGTSFEDYKKIGKTWMVKNSELVKREYRAKLLKKGTRTAKEL